MPKPPPVLLLTRPAAQSRRFARDCRAVLGADVPILISPILKIVPRPLRALPKGLAGIVLTSENGLAGLGATGGEGLRAYCVGDRTAEAARKAGCDAVSAGGAVEDLIALIRADPPEGPLLHLRGAESRGDPAASLRDAGIAARSRIVYDQVPQKLTTEAYAVLAGSGAVVAPVFSPRSAALLGEAARGATARLCVAALSLAVARGWAGPEPEMLAVAAHPGAAAMLDLLETIYNGKFA